jgi:hypothetical protein
MLPAFRAERARSFIRFDRDDFYRTTRRNYLTKTILPRMWPSRVGESPQSPTKRQVQPLQVYCYHGIRTGTGIIALHYDRPLLGCWSQQAAQQGLVKASVFRSPFDPRPFGCFFYLDSATFDPDSMTKPFSSRELRPCKPRYRKDLITLAYAKVALSS